MRERGFRLTKCICKKWHGGINFAKAFCSFSQSCLANGCFVLIFVQDLIARLHRCSKYMRERGFCSQNAFAKNGMEELILQKRFALSRNHVLQMAALY
jgi:hypothetical protein